jgi:hypothetical protein
LEEARDDWPANREYIVGLQNETSARETEIKSLEGRIEEFENNEDNLCHGEDQELKSLRREYRRAKKLQTDQTFELQSLIMELRNDKVFLSLQEEYRKYPNATTLDVFCVGNKMYWACRKEFADVTLPKLELSGILKLRRYCIRLVAESHLRATKTYVRDEIPALIGSVQLWVEAGARNGSAESKQQILDAILAIERELDEVRTQNVCNALFQSLGYNKHLPRYHQVSASKSSSRDLTNIRRREGPCPEIAANSRI